MIALIMAGGVGTRFWPQSRKKNPKQFLSILSEKTMIQMTVDRLSPIMDLKDIYIVTSADQKKLTQDNLPKLPEENIIIEPFGMNTAPCIGLSAIYLRQRYSINEQVLVLPADHLIEKKEQFLANVQKASAYAEKDNLVTFGIKPLYPATGYGYIEGSDAFENGVYGVARFKEKPNQEVAEQFLASGNFFWNSGMFLWKLETIIAAFSAYLPKVYKLLEDISHSWKDKGIETDISELYKQMPSIPIDIGIMEQAEKRVVLSVDLGWSDVGSWKALYKHLEKDGDGNSLTELSYCLDSKNNLVKSSKFVALVGVENLVVVDTEDSLLVSRIDESEKVKKIVDYLKIEHPELT